MLAYNSRMWSNLISIDKGKDNKFKRIISEIEEIRELSSAVEDGKYRKYIYMAGLCDYADTVRQKVENAVIDLILTDYKLGFYMKRLNYGSLNYSAAALISTLIYLDYDTERAFLERVLMEMSNYDIDGIYNFRIKPVKAGWKEIADMCNRLFEVGTDEVDIYNVISYITATKTQKPVALSLCGGECPVLTNPVSGSEIKIRRLFGIADYDLINAVISVSATKLVVENYNINKETLRVLKHIVRVKII